MSHGRVTLNYVSGTRNQNVRRNKLPLSMFVAVSNLLRNSISKMDMTRLLRMMICDEFMITRSRPV
jgi:hypothetical protein